MYGNGDSFPVIHFRNGVLPVFPMFFGQQAPPKLRKSPICSLTAISGASQGFFVIIPPFY